MTTVTTSMMEMNDDVVTIPTGGGEERLKSDDNDDDEVSSTHHPNTTNETNDGASSQPPLPIINKDYNKYKIYSVTIDSQQDNKSTEIKLCSWERPHMRSFHCSWWSFFISFFMWFAITPLLGEIQDDLNFTNQEIWNSSITSVSGTVFMRLLLGPLCDKYGARILISIVLVLASIPCGCVGLIHTVNDLYIIRALIGIAGGTFVMCQYWTSTMFTKEVVGTANALVAGWGNLGAGITQIIMGSLLFPFFKLLLNGNSELAWRWVSIVPASIGFITGIVVYYISDDSPKGNYKELKYHTILSKEETSGILSFTNGICNRNTWYLAIQYGCCFGVELTMNTATILYFKDVYGQSTESAAAIASIFGWMNLFARGMGGFYSDYANVQIGLQGRLWIVTVLLFAEGIFIFIFSNTGTLAGSIMVMIWFSFFVQAAEGAVYGIVPYVNPKGGTGSISGIVGAGGNAGATIFGLFFRQFSNYRLAFNLMGFTIVGSAFLSYFISIHGQNTLFSKTIVVGGSTDGNNNNGDNDLDASGQLISTYDDYEEEDEEYTTRPATTTTTTTTSPQSGHVVVTNGGAAV